MDCIKTGDLNRVSVSQSQPRLEALCPVNPLKAFKRLTRFPSASVCLSVLVQLMELHQQGADFLLQDAAGCTLLHHAVEAGGKEVLKYLIDNGEGGGGEGAGTEGQTVQLLIGRWSVVTSAPAQHQHLWTEKTKATMFSFLKTTHTHTHTASDRVDWFLLIIVTKPWSATTGARQQVYNRLCG